MQDALEKKGMSKVRFFWDHGQQVNLMVAQDTGKQQRGLR